MSTIQEDVRVIKDLEQVEGEIIKLRAHLEHPEIKIEKKSESAIVVTVVKIREKIVELGQKVDFAIKLGIDPNRSEILRLRANFGRYWPATEKS